MHHTPPNMKLCGAASQGDAFSETARIIEQYFVFSDVEKHRRKSRQVTIQWRCPRVAKILFAEIQLGSFLQSVKIGRAHV